MKLADVLRRASLDGKPEIPPEDTALFFLGVHLAPKRC